MALHCSKFLMKFGIIGIYLGLTVNRNCAETATTPQPPNYWTTSSIKPTEPAIGCPCTREDPYGVLWIIPGDETLVRPCPGDSIGNASWKCNYVNGRCQFNTPQPNYSGCTSLAVVALRESVLDNRTEVADIWINVSSLTAQANGYFGQEIFNILDIVTLLLDRQQSEIANNRTRALQSYLPLQISTTIYGAETMANLISNEYQWGQLQQAEQADESLLKLLGVSDDVAFRLANVAQSESQSLRCDFSFSNIVISSSYWNGQPSITQDCGLLKSSKSTATHSTSPDTFLRFPMVSNDGSDEEELVGSYILLPENILVPGKAYKASGVFIPLISRLEETLPGSNNVFGREEKVINSPLISYTLYDPDSNNGQAVQLPDRTHVQLVYKHNVIAKYPPVRNIRRWLGKDEEPSTVMSSSLCSYLLLAQKSNGASTDSLLWSWDNQGCRVASTNRTHTVCHCDHLTGFSNLMDFHRYIGSDAALDATSMTCTILSIICLFLTFVILTVLRPLRTHRTTLTQNLCVTLLISHLLILITLDKHLLPLNEEACATMGIFLHYMLLASFMWMFIEGVQLYRMATNVFNVMTIKWTTFYIILAYSMPFLIVGITILSASSAIGVLEVYSGDEICWLTGENWTWSFGAPVAIMLLVNFVFLLIALRSSYHLQQKANDESKLRKMKKITIRVISLTCLLGLTWLTGFLLYSETTALAFIFTIANGLQGVCIFVDRCLLNVKIRTALLDGMKRFHSYLVSKWDKNSVWIKDMKEQHMPKFRTPSRSSSTNDREAANNLQNKNGSNRSTNSSGHTDSTIVSSTNCSLRVPDDEQLSANHEQGDVYLGSDVKVVHQFLKRSSARVRRELPNTSIEDVDELGNF